MLIWNRKYVRQIKNSSRNEEQDLPLARTIFGSVFSTTSRTGDIESLTSNGWSRTEKIAFLNDCREASSGYNSASSDSSKWAWRDVGRTSRDTNR